MPSQRPFFLSTFFAALRQQSSSSLSSGTTTVTSQNKHTSPASSGYSAVTSASASSNSASRSLSHSTSVNQTSPSPPRGGVVGQLPLHPSHNSHATQHQNHNNTAMPIPQTSSLARRRRSDSSSEGYREVTGADKLYIGGFTAAGEEKFFRLGVVRRIRSVDRLSLDRLSL